MDGDGETDERSDDDDAVVFAGLYQGLRRLAAVVGPTSADPDDLVQEAVARVLRKRRLASIDRPGPYLARTIVNLASNDRRRDGRWRRAAVRLGSSDPLIPAVYPSDLGDLEQLSARERGAVYLHEVDGHSFEKVAEVLGCSVDAARQAASRGRRQLRKLLEEGK